MFRFALLSTASAATLDLTWKDCGAKHSTVIDVSPDKLHTGATETVTGTGTTDEEVTSAHFTATVSALGTELTSCDGDATSDITCTLPMGVGSITVKAVSFPLAKGEVKIPVVVQTSSIIPPSLASIDMHIAATDQNSESVICLDVHTEQESFESEVGLQAKSVTAVADATEAVAKEELEAEAGCKESGPCQTDSECCHECGYHPSRQLQCVCRSDGYVLDMLHSGCSACCSFSCVPRSTDGLKVCVGNFRNDTIV